MTWRFIAELIAALLVMAVPIAIAVAFQDDLPWWAYRLLTAAAGGAFFGLAWLSVRAFLRWLVPGLFKTTTRAGWSPGPSPFERRHKR